MPVPGIAGPAQGAQAARVSAVPAVSVVLPVRDGAATLARAIASVRAQTWADWELLVVDDGSRDATPEVLNRLARAEPRLRVLAPGRVGLVAALNAGLAAARGEFIARLDADDEAHPERLAAQVEWLRRQPDLGLVGCRVGFGGDAAASRGYALHVAWLNGIITPEEHARSRFIESPLAHPSVLFRRELVARHGGYREGDFPEDYELWLRWLEAGVRMAKVPRELLTWHDAPGRLSRTDPRYDPDAFFRVKAGPVAREVGRLPGPPGREVWIWGAGRPTRRRAAPLGAQGLKIAGYVDVDPRKTGRAVAGVPVIAPAALPPPGTRIVLAYVATRGARELIRGELERRGYAEGRDFLLCA